MLIKVGHRIINTKAISFIDLYYSEMPIIPECVRITTNYDNIFFFDEEADLLRWYFAHPTSDVVDIKVLKGDLL